MAEKTIREWCNEIVRRPGHGMETDMETVCLYQDAIGHSCEEELTEISNDRSINETFYRIYGVAYGTVEAIKFYMRHSDNVTRIIEEKEEAENNLEKANKAVKEKEEVRAQTNAELIEAYRKEEKAKHELYEAMQALEKAQQENIILKAKLYDLMAK